MTTAAPVEAGAVTYSAEGPRDEDFRGVSFVSEPFAEDTEITGPMNLVMWVSSTVDDMDIFATIHNIAPDGSELIYREGKNLPVAAAKGWLRASHRKLDPALSTAYRPYHAHDEVQKVTPGEAVKLEVEILPMSALFKKGHRIRLDVQPWDDDPNTRFGHDNSSHWQGENSIHTGGDQASYLLLPVIPPK